jgi:hypothetical protein
MNPQSATMPSPSVAPATPPHAPSPGASSSPSMVTNIPVHTQQAPVVTASEDHELDKIMHDVGQELKKEDKQPEKHGFLGFGHGHKPKPLVKVTNPPVNQTALAGTVVPVQAVSQAAEPVVITTAASAVAAVPGTQSLVQPAKIKTHRSVPVFVIFVALCVTGFLVAAAIAAYRQT